MQEARLPGTFLRVRRWLAEALAPDGSRLVEFRPLEHSCGPLQHFTGHTLAAQVAEHTPRAVAAPGPRNMLFGKPLLGEPAAPFELVQQRGKLVGIGVRPVQLVRQFKA